MSLRIGVAVSRDSVRAVSVRDGHIVWARESPVDDEVPLEQALATLLATIPMPRWPRPPVSAAIGPAQAQVKRLTGLPAVNDARVLAKLVQESPGRFFLKNGIPLAMTGVRLTGDGDAWSGALDEPVVRTISDACRHHGCPLRVVVPTALVLGRSLEDARIVWRDGDVAAELTLQSGALTDIRRLPSGSEHEASPPVVRPQLRALGEESWRFADAFAAALTRDDEPIAARPGRAAAHHTLHPPRWRLIAAVTALTFTAIAAAFTPGIAAARAASRARSALGVLAVRRTVTVRDEVELRRVTSALEQLAAFQVGRRSPTVFLAELSDALPPTAQVAAVRIDSAGGTMVLLAPQAGDAVAKVERLSRIESPAIIGPVTREFVGHVEKERVTVRFTWRRSTQPGTHR
ncbi:MAG: hypothetical protein ACJ79K_05095 [Gemmatimonadaceae bacterium]